MMKKVSRSGLMVLLILSVTTIIGVFDITIQPGAAVVLAESDNGMNMNPIIMHIHLQLSVLVNNSPIDVPEQIGIDPSLWKDHSLDEYGMQSMPEMNMSAMAPLHTHDNSGIVHVESTINRDYTLGEFLNIWGINLEDQTVKMTADDKPIADFKEHILSDGEQIRLEIR
jgi:hypothetical protein